MRLVNSFCKEALVGFETSASSRSCKPFCNDRTSFEKFLYPPVYEVSEHDHVPSWTTFYLHNRDLQHLLVYHSLKHEVSSFPVNIHFEYTPRASRSASRIFAAFMARSELTKLRL
jgi:hypothetical protein